MPVSSLCSSNARPTGHRAAVVLTAAIVLLGIAALLVSIVVLIAGGFVIDAGRLHLSLRRWPRPATLALVACALCAGVPPMRRQSIRILDGLTASIERHAPAIAIVLAASAAACGIAHGTYAASGSDAAGYIAEAELLVTGDLLYDEPLARQVQWADATSTFAPLAFRPALAAGRLVPTYPPGLPLAMAVARGVGEEIGPFLVVPLLGAVAVLATFVLARIIHSRVAGLVAAVLLATSPIFLFEIVQPMSDVPATAWWTLALALALGASQTRESARRRAATFAFLAGLVAGMAVLTRPNLIPLIVPLVIAVRLKADPMSTPASTVALLAGLVPGAAVLAWLQWRMYGSPLASGYGPGAFRDFFSLANIAPNIRDYTHRLLIGELPASSLACIAVTALLLHRRSGRRRHTGTPDLVEDVLRPRRAHVILLAGFAATVLVFYLPYGVFPDWWYLRFLLPALPVAFSLIAVVVARAHAELPRSVSGLLLLVALTVVCSCNVVIARTQQAFLLRASEARYQLAGRYLAAASSPNAVVVTVQDSAAVRVYSHLPILRWDLLPIDLDTALAQLTELGRHPLLLVEEWERPQLRAKFPASRAARLDWAPVADFGDPVRVHLFDPVNRTPVTDRVH